jgi:hypothetical protein
MKDDAVVQTLDVSGARPQDVAAVLHCGGSS